MAQYELGWHYLEGKRWQKDVTRALMLLRAAAKQGNVCAQEELGMIYFKGFDVAADFSQAYTWFVLAGADSSETKAVLSQIRSKLSPVETQRRGSATNAQRRAGPGTGLSESQLYPLERPTTLHDGEAKKESPCSSIRFT